MTPSYLLLKLRRYRTTGGGRTSGILPLDPDVAHSPGSQMPESSKWPRASSHPHSAGPQDVLGDLLPSSQTFVCHREAFDRPRVHSFHRALAALHSFVH